jgi:hypothetical protein
MTNKATIYHKLADARSDFHKLELKKSGRNAFAGFDYFELSDFVLQGMECMKANGLLPVISFPHRDGVSLAVMSIYDMDSGEHIEIESPMSESSVSKQPVQNLGACHTYLRRYLWYTAMEVIEHDALDAVVGNDKPSAPKAQVKKKVSRKPAKPAKREATEGDDLSEKVMQIESESDALELVQLFTDIAVGMHSDSLDNLVSFWKNNQSVVNELQKNWPEAFTQLKTAFAEIRSELEGGN